MSTNALSATPLFDGDPRQPDDHKATHQQIVMILKEHLMVDDPTRQERDEAHIGELVADFTERFTKHPNEHPIQTPLRVKKAGDIFKIIGGNYRYLAGCRCPFITAYPCLVMAHDADEVEIYIETVRDNTLHKRYSPMEDAANIIRLRQLRPGMTLAKAAEALNIDPTKATKILKIFEFFPKDLLPFIGERDGQIPISSAYEFARLIEQKGDETTVRELSDRTIKGLLTRDDAVRKVKELLNKSKPKEKSPKAIKVAHGGFVATITGELFATWDAFKAKMEEALKKMRRDDLPPDTLSALLK